jgi:hypothetical protein
MCNVGSTRAPVQETSFITHYPQDIAAPCGFKPNCTRGNKVQKGDPGSSHVIYFTMWFILAEATVPCLIVFSGGLLFGILVADPIFLEATLYGTKPIK